MKALGPVISSVAGAEIPAAVIVGKLKKNTRYCMSTRTHKDFFLGLSFMVDLILYLKRGSSR